METTPASAADKRPKKAGRQVGAPGHSRQVSLPVSATVNHTPATCACCGQALDSAEFIARTGLSHRRAAQRQHGAPATGCRLIWGNGNRGG